MTQDEITERTPAPTRRAQAKAERRQTLIEATITSITQYGLSGTTIERVTEIAGTSIGLANFYFENKERLFEAVLQHLADTEQALWQDRLSDATLTPAERLIALIDARFDARICNPRTLAVWFAFWGDAGARGVFRRVVEPTDTARLAAVVPLIQGLATTHGDVPREAYSTALGLEAFYDGLWLNLLLYPDDFRRIECRNHAVEHLAALFPNHFNGLQTGAGRTAAAVRAMDPTHDP